MGTSLTGTKPKDTYDSLIKVTDNGPLSGTAKYLSDGLGNDSALALSTTGVGVGTTTISSVGSTKVIEVGTAATGGTLTLGGSTAFRISGSTSGVDMYYAASAPINIYTAGTERVKIDAAGNVGIGTSSPAAKLHVAGENIIVDRTGGDPFVEFYTGGTTNNVALYGGASTGLRAFVGGAERIRVTTNGLTFNGDTAAANALDDYEEGTFTATLKGSSSDPSTPVTTTANYTKIGRQVTVSVMFANVNTTGASGSVTVLGLPFSCVTAGVGPAITENFTFGASRTTVSSFVDSAVATTIRLFVSGNDTSFENLLHNAGASRYLYISLTYFV